MIWDTMNINKYLYDCSSRMFPNISVGLPHADKGQSEKYKYSEKKKNIIFD